MKTMSAALLAHYQLPCLTVATGWLVIRRDDATFGWTDHDEIAVIEGVTYRVGLGLTPTATHATKDFTVDTLDVTAFMDISTEREIIAGVWDTAEVTVFEYNWAAPPTVVEGQANILKYGQLGHIKRVNNIFTAEIRGLTQKFQRRIGRAYMPTCPWRHALWNGTTYVSSIECGVDLVAGGHIQAGTITVAETGELATREFSDGANPKADGYFQSGIITFTSGDNAGISREVGEWTAKKFILGRPFPYPVAVGDAYTAVRGDDKTKGTCKDVYANYVNFGGFPDIPGINAVFSRPSTDVGVRI